jgi:hypothetical protein
VEQVERETGGKQSRELVRRGAEQRRCGELRSSALGKESDHCGNGYIWITIKGYSLIVGRAHKEISKYTIRDKKIFVGR